MNGSHRKDLIQYCALTFAFSWLCWLPGVLGYLGYLSADAGVYTGLEALGALGPAVAALIVARRTGGKQGSRALWRSAFNVRTGWRFAIGASLGLLALHGLARLLLVAVSDSAPPAPSGLAILALVPLALVIFVVGGGLGEEIGWRGYALVRLQGRHNALTASLILSAIWTVWHLPLFFYGGTNQSLIPFWLWIVPVVALGVMLTWVYNKAGTIFAAALLHTMGNLAYELFPVLPTEDAPDLTGFIIITILYVTAAVALVAVCGKALQGRNGA